MSDELRDQIAKRIEQECWAAAKVGGAIDFGKFVQAAMEIVGPLVVERDRMHMLLDKMRLEHADYARDAGHLQEQTQRERDLLLWLHAEAVWQQEVYRLAWARVMDDADILRARVDELQVELDDLDQELDAERIAKPTMARIHRADEAAAIERLKHEHQKWADAIAETAVRLSDAGYHGQLADSVTRLIAERDADRESRFRWAEEAAELVTQRDEARHLAAQAIALIANGEPGHPGYEARRSCWVRLDTIARWQAARRSWGAATVEAAPAQRFDLFIGGPKSGTIEPVPEGISLTETRTGTDWCPRCHEESGTNRNSHGGVERCSFCWSPLVEHEPSDAAGVSGTGTEASDGE